MNNTLCDENDPRARLLAAAAALFFPLSLIWQELVFHCFLIGTPGTSFLYAALFACVIGLPVGMVWMLLRRPVLRTVFSVLILLFFQAFFWTHVIYYKVFVTFWAPFSTMAIAGQAFDYKGMILENAARSAHILFLLALPLPLYLLLLRRVRPSGFRGFFPQFGAELGCLLLCLLILTNGERGYGSPYDLVVGRSSISDSMETLGVLATSVCDSLGPGTSAPVLMSAGSSGGSKTTTGRKSSVSVNLSPEELCAGWAARMEGGEDDGSSVSANAAPAVEYVPRVMDIDFDQLIAETTDPSLRSLHEYFASREPSYTNEYTGLFKGKNLIWITVEGMSRFIIDEKRTPTLWKLQHEGFYCEHYYTPLWYGSTSGGEWANLTGIPPQNGGYVAMQHSGELGTDLYFTPPRRFKDLGYDCVGFHNNFADYYGRNLSHPNMGLRWIAYGTGYQGESVGGTLLWPQSDLRLWEESRDYIDFEKPFMAYYMTISGHAQYNWGGNMMSARHHEEFRDLPYSEEAKAYLACQYEVELMLSQMVKDLEAAGILEQTVIVLTTDHVPYNNKDMCDELAAYEMDDQTEWFENALILYCSSMEKPVVVDKYCSSIDLLPTVLNLFDIEYDSRLLAGCDILSDSPQFVMFNASRSFISDRCLYNGRDGSIKPFAPYSEADITQEYINDVENEIRNRAGLSGLILQYDYYHILFGQKDNAAAE